ncbi:MAG: ferritin [Bacillota bacterium]
MNEKVKKLLNEQINKEFYSAYLYLDISNFYYDANLNGFGNWYKVQAQEERDHAMLFSQYLQNNGVRPMLAEIAAPDKAYSDFSTPLQVSFEHEKYVTALINAIYAEAQADRDYRTCQFLDWFIKEQGEEEKNADENIKRFELFGHDGKGLYMLDSELGARVYAAPSLVLD